MGTDENDYVYLCLQGKIVGTAKILKGSGLLPKREIHGHPLQEFSRTEEDLIAIYQAQIYREYENELYPFKYYDFDGLPVELGDLNNDQKKFRAIVAWDSQQTIPNRAGCDLGENPKIVYAECSAAVGISNQRSNLNHSDESEVDEVLLSDSDMEVDTPENTLVNTMNIDDSSTATESLGSNSQDNAHRSDLSSSSRDAESNMLNHDDFGMKELSVQRRRYIFKSRERGPPKEITALRKNRLQLSKRFDNPFLKARQCCRNRCFGLVDPVYCFAKYKKLMRTSQLVRKQELIRLLNPDTRKFRFDGIDVCVAFMEKGFGFSRDLQCSV